MHVPNQLLPLTVVFSFLLIAISASNTTPTPKTTESDESVETTTENFNNDTVPEDLYVIKTIVYEVGILTDAGNDTGNSSQEQVDVAFFDPSVNDSVIDLSNIPVPIQTNVSGVSVIGFVPAANLGSLLLPPDSNLTAPVLPDKQITVAQNISTNNPDKGSQIISNLPKLLGLPPKNESDKANDTRESDTDKDESS